MNILLVGGSGSLINNLIIKLNKEGHRLYLLTGNRYKQEPYQKVFERYDFTYDCASLNDIFGSIRPDIVVYTGAYDSNYHWQNEEEEAVRYSACLTNLLMAYVKNCSGRFIYISSHEVFSGHYEDDIDEGEVLSPIGYRGMVLAQAEETCESYRVYQKRDVVTLRIDHLYSIPSKRKEVNNICSKMCLDVLEKGTIPVVENSSFSLLYETDAVEYIYKLISCTSHKYPVYNLASSIEVSQRELAEMVKESMGGEVYIDAIDQEENRRVLSNKLMDSEFGNPFHCELKSIVSKMASEMKKNSYAFLSGDDVKMPFWKRVREKSGGIVKAIVPFVENLLFFIPFLLLNYFFGGEELFTRIDFYLIYVLLFAIVYGQQQAIVAATLSVIGYFGTQIFLGSGIEIMLESDIYLWIAQLFIVGMLVGYLKDQLTTLQHENDEEKEFLAEQLSDIQDINYSNVRVKDALETQIVNQNDSVGKIYSITSALDQYSPEEVLFYAARVLSQLMRSKDVAIYLVSNADYARLFSYTSANAKKLGNSIKYPEMGEVYETLLQKKVYINRRMDERYPLMANAIYENDKMKMLIFIWDITWERMTLGQANQFSVISYLIQNASLRANKYLAVLEEERFVQGTRVMETEAFTELAQAYLRAESQELTECTLLRILVEEKDNFEAAKQLAGKLRLSDYVGTLKDGKLYVLLANTNIKDAQYVINRFAEMGYETQFVEGMIE